MQTLGTRAVKKGLDIVPHIPGTEGSVSCYPDRNPQFSSFAEVKMQKLSPTQFGKEQAGTH